MAGNLDQVATACNLTVRRVNQLVKEGVLPKEARGEYNLGKCMAAYIRYLQTALSKKSMMDSEGNITSLQGGRDELLRIQIERETFELAKAKGLSMPVEVHEMVLSDLIQETKARVRAVGARVAGDLVGETSRLMIQAKLERAHDEVLLHLSKVVPRIPVVVAGPEDNLAAELEAKGIDPASLIPREDYVEGVKPKIIRTKSKKKPDPSTNQEPIKTKISSSTKPKPKGEPIPAKKAKPKPKAAKRGR